MKFLILLLVFFGLSQAEGISPEYFVSLLGSDAWDGTSPEHIYGTNTGPWLTVQHALRHLRLLRPNHPTADDHVTIILLPGTHFLPSMLSMDVRDSYLTIKSMDDEEVILSGGMKLSVPEGQEGAIKKTTFRRPCGEAYLGAQRLIPARSTDLPTMQPNLNIARAPFNTIKGLLKETPSCSRDAHGYGQNCPEEDRHGFVFEDEFSQDWSYLNQTRVLVFHSWIAEYAIVSNITVEDGKSKVYFQDPLKHAPVGNFIQSGGWRFLIFNNLALLDQPGESVCVDLGHGMSELSYITPEQSSDRDDLFVAQLETLILINKASHITFQGIHFKHSTSEGVDGYNWGTQAALKFMGSSNIIISDCHFSQIGMIGAYFTNSKDVHIENSVFTDIGYHAVMMYYKNPNDDETGMRDITVENNMFNGCGISSFWQPACIWIGGYENISVIHNEFTNVPYSPLRIHGLMPHGADYWEQNGIIDPTRDDYVYHFEFNYFHNYGLGVLSDFGAIYISIQGADCDHPTSDQEYNDRCYVYSHSFNNLVTNAYGYHNDGNFLYSDVSSSRNTFEKNVMYGAGSMAIYHHCGENNMAVNNVVHSMGTLNYMYGGCDNAGSPQSYENFRNIYLLDNMDHFQFGRPWDRYHDSAPDFHNNVYWSFVPGDEAANKFPGKLTWEEWKQSGNDSESVWQDPLFEDPKNHKYVLKEDSVAWSLGIQQIDLDHFGIQRNYKGN